MNHTTARGKKNREHTDLNGFHLVSLKYKIMLIDTSLYATLEMALFPLFQHGGSILLFLIFISFQSQICHR